jgi:mannose-1-phosphate guanylyltransferase
MDAVILVGGEGTRLRPLTLTTPKPMLPLVDRPFLAFPFEQLRRAGVERVILSCGYLPDAIEAEFGGDGGRWIDGLRVEYAVEPEPLGTAGAIRFAAEGRVSSSFLVLNGDILSDFDLASMVERHRERGARATIALTPVDDPTRYGLVRAGADGRVLGFLEKPRPEDIDTDLINAGAYVLEPDVLERIPSGRSVSIEREVFPDLVGRGLYAMALAGSWFDIGTPESYLAANEALMAGRLRTNVSQRLASMPIALDPSAEVADSAELVGPVFVGPGARIGDHAHVSASSIGAGANIGRRSTLAGAMVHEDAEVGAGSSLRRAIVGAGAALGERCSLGELALVGAGVELEAGTHLARGAKAFPEELEL